eukprot:1707116-Pleurochrysis_carterae.AAC.1
MVAHARRSSSRLPPKTHAKVIASIYRCCQLSAPPSHQSFHQKLCGHCTRQVTDNGRGIAQSDVPSVALRHHTSKLTDFKDLGAIRSFGFRGEALNSLASLSTLSISTRTSDETVGMQIGFSRAGAVTKQSAIARDVGTTVCVERLFEPFPVRRRELLRSAQAEMRKMLAAVQARAREAAVCARNYAWRK